jgi:hypothetical protein
MAKKPASLESLMAGIPELETSVSTLPHPPEVSPVKSNVATSERRDAKPPRRSDLPHTSIYLHPNVKKAIAQIGLDFGRKPHDLMMEGIDLMLLQYGKPSSKDLANK